MEPSLDIVIVNWNAGPQLRDCLQSVASANAREIRIDRVVVVDNASADGSAEGLDAIRLPLRILRNSENRGFAAACNQGARGSKATYVLFLNPDTLLQTNSISVPLRYMEDPANSSVGIAGIQLTDEFGGISRSCSRFPTTLMFVAKMLGMQALLPPGLARQPMSEWDHTCSRDVDQVIGAFFLVRRALFEALDGFDERFFVYFEEVDFCLRAAARGQRRRYLTECRAFHRGGGCSAQARARRLEYNVRSRLEYGHKHFGRISATILVIATLTIEPLSRMVRALLSGSAAGLRETVLGFRGAWKAGPALLLRVVGSARSGQGPWKA